MLNDTLSTALSNIINSEKVGKKECTIKPASKFIEVVLTIFHEKGYLGTFKREKELGGEKIVVDLIGRINNCKAIKPRKSIKVDEIEKFEKRFLPAKGFGMIILSTPQGMITNTEARKKKIGGRLIAYCY